MCVWAGQEYRRLYRNLFAGNLVIPKYSFTHMHTTCIPCCTCMHLCLSFMYMHMHSHSHPLLLLTLCTLTVSGVCCEQDISKAEPLHRSCVPGLHLQQAYCHCLCSSKARNPQKLRVWNVSANYMHSPVTCSLLLPGYQLPWLGSGGKLVNSRQLSFFP